MNVLESLLHTLQKPRTAPHVGEVMTIWTTYAAAESSKASILTLLNHTQDPELKGMIEHYVNDVLEPMVNKLTDLMRDEGIPFPASPPEVAKADQAAIPPGAKLNDPMIANRLAVDLEGLLIIVHGALLSGTRGDIIATFYNYHTHILAQSFTVKHMLEKRGWLRMPPPYHVPHASPPM
ncbi:MAG: DUF3231 family protein [Bacillota bacterium]